MPFRPILFCLAVLLALNGCSQKSDSDYLTQARRHLRMAPCGAAPAVAGVAGVYKDPREVYLGDWIVVAVCHLDKLIKTSEAKQQPITLFIEGLDTGNRPVGVDLDSGILTFILDRTEDNKDVWKPLLYNPLFDSTTSMRISAGLKGEHALPRAEGANMTLVLHKIYTDLVTWIWLGILAAIVVALVAYSRKSDLLREGPSIGGLRRPFSLGRTQMAWWFFLILVGYNFIFLVTQDRDTIPPSLLALMGISAATALAAVVISMRSAGGGDLRKLIDAEIASVDEALKQIAADLDETARRAADPATAGSSAAAAGLRSSLEKRQADLEARRASLVLERTELMTSAPSAGFWNDLVRDDRGTVSLDRFQIVAWSVALGCLFLGSVIWELTMPEFSTTLLALMGISSGTYIGFKLPAK
jgi:hypothetical protein